jgi:YVTN family beta-propeller protein
VSNLASNTLSVIDTATNTVTTTVPTGVGPNHVRIGLDGLVYVTLTYDDQLIAIDPITNAHLSVVQVGNEPEDFDITPDGLFAYVANYADNSVSVVDLTAMTVLQTLPGFAGPNGVQVVVSACSAPGKVLTSLGDALTWIGLKNSDDQGTKFDLRVQLFRNGSPVASGLRRCITGVTRNPNNAIEAPVAFDSFVPETFNAGDTLTLTIQTRIGTNADESKCPGHNSGAGLRLYYDAAARQSRFGATLAPDPQKDFYLRRTGAVDFLSDVAPTAATAKFRDSPPLSFANGNVWKDIGTWNVTIE